MTVKLLWQIDNISGGVWRRWARAYHLGGQDVWHAKATSNDPWGWRNLIKIRDELLEAFGGVEGTVGCMSQCTRNITRDS